MMDYESLYDTISTGTYAIQNVVSLASFILSIIALWKIYNKANEPGWAAIVPFYNSYVLFKISGKKKLFWPFLAASIVFTVVYVGFIVYFAYFAFEDLSAFSYSEALAGFVVAVFLWLGIMFVCSIAILIFHIFQCIGMAKNFGLSSGYAVGLIFIPVVFYCIIAFSKKIHYVGDGTYYGTPNGYMPNGYAPNGYMPYGQAPVYMNSYMGQPQQGYPQYNYGAQQSYPQNPYGVQQGFGQQGYPQNSYNAQPQGYSQESYNTQPQNYGQNPYSEQNDNFTRPNDYNEQ